MRRMRIVKMMLVLVLSCVFCVSADFLHDNFRMTACSDSDGESMYGLDGEVVWYADFVNQRGVEPQPDFIHHGHYPEGTYELAVLNQQICKDNLKVARKNNEDPLEFDPPSSLIIYNRDSVDLGVKNVLICHVTGFYPAPVEIYWTKNGDNVTQGISTNLPYPNKDGSFHQTSGLVFTPQHGDIYGCTVKHSALNQPLTRFWEVEKTQPSVGPAVFCGLGLTAGLLGVAAGTFFLVKGNECR